jgi:hypothetical protein
VVAWDFLDRRMTVAAAAVAGVATLPRPTMTGDPAPVEPSMTGRASLAYTFF